MYISGYGQYWNNIGRVRNLGAEIELYANVFSNKDFKWKITGNLSLNRNKLIDLGGEPYQFNEDNDMRGNQYVAFLGAPSIQYYGYKTNGVWNSQAEIDEWEAQGNKYTTDVALVPGGLKVVDVNHDGVLDINDRVVLGNPFPDFTWGLSNTFKYKDFDLTFMFQGVQGVEIVNGDIFYNEFRKYEKNYTQNRWVSPSYPGDGKTPYFTNGMNIMVTDYAIEDGSYVSLRDVTFGYTMPKKITDKLYLRGLRAYISAQNLLYFYASGYRGLNPEGRASTGSSLVDGYQRGSFPIQRTFSFGLEITL
jgi:hypothetical protein